MDPEYHMLSEINEAQKDKHCVLLVDANIKKEYIKLCEYLVMLYLVMNI